jgi:hypothetical protein
MPVSSGRRNMTVGSAWPAHTHVPLYISGASRTGTSSGTPRSCVLLRNAKTQATNQKHWCKRQFISVF